MQGLQYLLRKKLNPMAWQRQLIETQRGLFTSLPLGYLSSLKEAK